MKSLRLLYVALGVAVFSPRPVTGQEFLEFGISTTQWMTDELLASSAGRTIDVRRARELMEEMSRRENSTMQEARALQQRRPNDAAAQRELQLRLDVARTTIPALATMGRGTVSPAEFRQLQQQISRQNNLLQQLQRLQREQGQRITRVERDLAELAERVERLEASRANSMGPISTRTDPTPPSTSERHSDALPSYSEWLRVEGLTIYYRYSLYLPQACKGNRASEPVAVGNWIAGWWEDRVIARSPAAQCVNGEWLALNLQPLLQNGTIYSGNTYCFNFRTRNRDWGQHGAFLAPGLEDGGPIMIPASNGVQYGRNPGFRVVQGSSGLRVELTNAGSRLRAC